MRSATDVVAGQKNTIRAMQKDIDMLKRVNEALYRMLEYYENPNSPPSADSLK